MRVIVEEKDDLPGVPPGEYVMTDITEAYIERSVSFARHILAQDDKEFGVKGNLVSWPAELVFEEPKP